MSIFDNDDWKDHGACVGVSPDLFFPEKGNSHGEAKLVCQTCPVREACLEYALVNSETHGVWGGTSERERRVLRRQRALARAAADAARKAVAS